MKKKALYAGSFDILTKGHLDIITRGAALFDELYIGLFYNVAKEGFFTIEERLSILRELTKDLANVKLVKSTEELAIDVAGRLEIKYLLRGLRDEEDYRYESNMARFNNELSGKIETVFLQSNPKYAHVSSSKMKELIYFKGNISAYVPRKVIEKLEEKQLETLSK
ncbi:MAG: pantetheine-phosphate adenylyltransferase [Streptococcaceae bacterium]|jgi:pantetheine-phosphate adenylyltransferase|nr:pantetheine-phosphate adenylyltransferase [Streptococcaceae bacterium]